MKPEDTKSRRPSEGSSSPERRYVITGAASGIGRAVAELAAEEGAALFLVDLDETRLRHVAEELSRQGARVETTVSDLTDPAQPRQVIENAVQFLGGLDVLVSNAGAPQYYRLTDLTVEAFDTAIALNVRAHWLLGQAAHPWLAESHGNLVATGSTTGHNPAPPQGAYSVAKAALLMLVKQMALEWGPDGIRCNSVSPGPTRTGLTEGVFNDPTDPKQAAIIKLRESHLPLRKIGEAREVAEAIMFLGSPRASQITGVDLLVDGGISVALMEAAGVGAGRSS